mgnify:CR=1 FL=1
MWFLLLSRPITGNNEARKSTHVNIKRGLKMFIRASEAIKTRKFHNLRDEILFPSY